MNEPARPSFLLIFAVALIVSLVLNLILRTVSLHSGKFVQWPKATSIETHVRPTPILGGLAIFLGVQSALLLIGHWSSLETRIMLASGALVVYGLVDDVKPLSVPLKLAGQILVVSMVLLAPSPESDPIFPQPFDEGLLNHAIAGIWLIGMINAVNFLDVMDGLAAGTSVIAALGMSFLSAFTYRDPFMAALALALAGGSLGFLVYNFYPARIFLGNSGSQLLGFVLGTLAMIAAARSASPVSVLSPAILLGIPLFEIAFTTTMRTLAGKAPWEGSKDHYALRLFRLGFSVRQIVLSTYIIGLVFVACAIWFEQAGTREGALFLLLLLALVGGGAGLWLSRVDVLNSDLVLRRAAQSGGTEDL